MLRTVLIFCLCVCWWSTAQAHDTHSPPEQLQPGDVGYRHVDFHFIYQELVREVNGEPVVLGPGDEGYRKEELQSTYGELYSSQKCHCKSGYCRPTVVRPTQLAAETGLDILVNRAWRPIPKNSLHHERTLSPELMLKLFPPHEGIQTADGYMRGHVCAYETESSGRLTIECAIIPKFIG